METSEALARRFFDDVWTAGHYDVIDLLLTSAHQHHISGETLVGSEAVKDMARSIRTAFPDVEFDIEDTVVERDKVVVRWSAHGTHTGSLGDEEPTGRRVEWTGMDLIRVKDGRIAEIWGNNDALGLWEQIE